MKQWIIGLVAIAALASCTTVKKTTVIEPAASSGCWVRLWEDPNFGGATDTIFGPGEFATMKNLPGAMKTDWNDKIDSIEVGPNASLMVWQDENFGNHSIIMGPGERRGNLSGTPDMEDEIGSMKITCR